MFKVAFLPGEDARGQHVFPLFGPSDSVFEKVAAPVLLPEVVRYIETLRPSPTSQYVLLNAMGASEWWGSNINGDAFTEVSLIHKPDDWTGNPLLDKLKAKDWPYGFPTFYFAHPFAHHRNKDATRAFGEVELAAWNPRMRRVELVTRVDKTKCDQFGGTGVWDKLKAGNFPDVSMGCCPPGTRVVMWDGTTRSIEAVRVGDVVLSHKSRARRVSNTMRRRYEGALYSIKVFGFRRPVIVTDEHPLWLIRGDQLTCLPTPSQQNRSRRQRHCTPLTKERTKGCDGCGVVPSYAFEWTRADAAEVGDYLAFPVPMQEDTSIGSIEEARLLGYYLAEGHVGNYNARPLEQITFSLSINEVDIAQDIEALARMLGASVVWHSEQPERGGRRVCVVHRELALKCLTYCGSGAPTKQLSHEVLYMPVGLQLAFLGAYLDGDGGTYKGSAYFSTASEVLADQLFVALARCGMIASINEILHHPSDRSVVRRDTTEYQVWVGTDFSTRLGPFTRKPVHASLRLRGQRFFYTYEGVTYVMAPILELEEQSYSADVFNFSVEEDDSYLVEGLATHNCKVPFDTSSITLDWKLYHEAQATFDKSRHRSPGDAVLEFHKKLKAKTGKGIPGLSVTRHDYDEFTRKHMNKILSDGRKVFVYNDYPRFFDISFVFIGADKTAKTMMKIADTGRVFWSAGGAELAEKLGYADADEDDIQEKTAGVSDTVLKTAFLGKLAKNKDAEIIKDTIPSQFAAKAVPVLTRGEKDLPKDVLDALGASPLEEALSTPTGLGMVLRPREFQRIVLIQMGHRPMAERLEREGTVFPRVSEELPVPMGPGFFSLLLARLLLPFMGGRSALGPAIEPRALVGRETTKEKRGETSSLSSDLLRKMGAAYNGYRTGVMELVAHSQDLMSSMALPSGELHKYSSAPVGNVFTPLAVSYLKLAFWNEIGVEQVSAGVERGSPSRNTQLVTKPGGYT